MKIEIEQALLEEIKKFKDFERIELINHQNENSVMRNLFRQIINVDDKTITFVINSCGINREFAYICYSIN
jgi:hypothetical protein